MDAVISAIFCKHSHSSSFLLKAAEKPVAEASGDAAWCCALPWAHARGPACSSEPTDARALASSGRKLLSSLTQ